MSERPFMQLYVSDFVGDTLHLSTEQIGAYMLLLMAMWNAGGKLPADDVKVARVVRLGVKKWRAIAPDLMAFLETNGVEIWHNRLAKELQKSAAKSERRATSGARGGSAKALKNNKPDVANASRLLQHLPDTREKEKRKSDADPSKPVDAMDEPSAQTRPSDDRVKLVRSDPVFVEIAAMRGMPVEAMQVSDRDGSSWWFQATEVREARQRLADRSGPEIGLNDNGLMMGSEARN